MIIEFKSGVRHVNALYRGAARIAVIAGLESLMSSARSRFDGVEPACRVSRLHFCCRLSARGASPCAGRGMSANNMQSSKPDPGGSPLPLNEGHDLKELEK